MRYTAIIITLALTGPASAQAMLGSPLNEYERGWDHGYQAINPGTRGPVFYSPFHFRSPADTRSDFERGIADGVERGQEDNGD
jgi:hypothetical protein